MRSDILALAMVGALCGCDGGRTDAAPPPGHAPTVEELGQMELWKLELMKADWASDQAVQRSGPSSWSASFAPDGSLIRPGAGEIRGREAIDDAFMADIYANTLAGLTWNPERAEVSRGGDMGYTVGRYVATLVDSAGDRKPATGMYVRIWSRQPDDSWKVELEIKNSTAQPEVLLGSASGEGSGGPRP